MYATIFRQKWIQLHSLCVFGNELHENKKNCSQDHQPSSSIREAVRDHGGSLEQYLNGPQLYQNAFSDQPTFIFAIKTCKYPLLTLQLRAGAARGLRFNFCDAPALRMRSLPPPPGRMLKSDGIGWQCEGYQLKQYASGNHSVPPYAQNGLGMNI